MVLAERAFRHIEDRQPELSWKPGWDTGIAAEALSVLTKEEKKLVEAAREGDAKAFAQLVRAYQARIFAYMSVRMPDPSSAPRLVADVFRKIYSSMRGSEESGDFDEELFQLAETKLRQYSRGSDSSWTRLCLEHDRTAGGHTPLASAERKGLEDCISGMEGGERHAFELRYGSGASLADVSRKVKRSEDVVQGMLASSLGIAKAAIKGKKKA
jgi:DNA-directed RNA polymerase specialized sigma24 family protein